MEIKIVTFWYFCRLVFYQVKLNAQRIYFWLFILGNNGYPVTHFWVHQEDGIYFESKGTHDHFRPQARRAVPERTHAQKNIPLKQTEKNYNKRTCEEVSVCVCFKSI